MPDLALAYALPEAVRAEADRRGWRITQIWNTHWHPDHTGGNAEMKAATGAIITGNIFMKSGSTISKYLIETVTPTGPIVASGNSFNATQPSYMPYGTAVSNETVVCSTSGA